ncbi:hypothetical protein [Paenibacillus glycanilyticus]|uniref:hypothetical protein n=1 Tax=Paenibacillus glycanilyticus TaxID=126569 RepID=UPI003EBF68EB
MKVIQSICLVVALLILPAFNTSTVRNLKVEDINSIQVVTGPQHSGELGNEEITHVINWLHLAKKTKVTGGFDKRPTVLKIKLNDGRLLVVTKAVRWIHTNNPDGSGFSQSIPIQDEILINFDSQRIQLKSPELFNWLTEITYVKLH